MMDASNPLEQICNRISASDAASVFVSSDFNDLASSVSIRKSLSRLEKAGLIRRVLQGVYEYPEYSSFLGEYVATSPHRVALALARNYCWSIVPSGDTALNQLGLSTQVPAEWAYASNGPYRAYSFGKTTIRFKRATNKDIAGLSYKSALLIQAIKAIGKDRLDASQMRKISELLATDEKAALLADGKHMTNWVFETVKAIFVGEWSV
jgi:hypothetical protein